MSKTNIIPKKIPNELWNGKDYSDIILYALGRFGPMEREIFINDPPEIQDRMNKNTFHKWAKVLKQHNWIEVNKEERKSVYNITALGLEELTKRLVMYQLDFSSLINIENKRIENNLKKISRFFEQYKVYDASIKLEFLLLSSEMAYDNFKDVFSLEKFYNFLLYLALNHPKFYPEKSISIDNFLEKYGETEKNITKTDIRFFLQKVIEDNIYQNKIYKINEKSSSVSLYFSSKSEYGLLFENFIKYRLKETYYLKKLIDKDPEISDLYQVYHFILHQLIQKFELFHEDLKPYLHDLITDYIRDIKDEIFKTPFSSLKEQGSIVSLPEELPKHGGSPISLKENGCLLHEIHYDFPIKSELDQSNEFLLNAYDKLFLEKDYTAALKQVNKALEKDTKSSITYELKSLILIHLEKYEDALKNVNIAIQNHSTPSELFVLKIHIFTFLLKFRDMVKFLEDFYEDWKANINIYTTLVWIFISYEEYKLVNWLLEKTENLDSKDEEVIYWEIFAAYNNKLSEKLEEGKYLEVLKVIDSSQFSNASFYKFKIQALMNLDKYSEALKSVEEAIKMYPKHPKHGSGIPISFTSSIPVEIQLMDLEKRFDELEQDEANISYGFEFEILKAEILFELEKYPEVIQNIDEIIALQPEFDKISSLYELRALSFFNLNDYNQVLNTLDSAIKANPNEAKNYFLKIDFLNDMGRNEEAEELLEKFIRLPFSGSFNLYQKAKYLAKLNKKDAALEVMNNLIQENPKNEVYYLRYGEILMILADYKGVIQFYEKTLTRDMESHSYYKIYIQIGRCWNYLGKPNFARESFMKSKEIALKENNQHWLRDVERYLSG
ncbi:MAG: hypothetical protein ACFFEN_03820 [Candidatus Thorarchaeota archaeon]